MRIVFDNPFEAGGSWFKGNVHTHTTNSDGQMTPGQVIRRYEEAGYDFLSITDHGVRTDTEDLSGSGILLIPGEEICVGSSEWGRFYHIVGLNVGEGIPVEDFQEEENPQSHRSHQRTGRRCHPGPSLLVRSKLPRPRQVQGSHRRRGLQHHLRPHHRQGLFHSPLGRPPHRGPTPPGVRSGRRPLPR